MLRPTFMLHTLHHMPCTVTVRQEAQRKSTGAKAAQKMMVKFTPAASATAISNIGFKIFL